MSYIEDRLRTLIQPVPGELIEYFETIYEGSVLGAPYDEMGLLDIEGCVVQTSSFREVHPTAVFFGGIVLDDPNTSNHHMYLSKRPLAGYIFFLDHDGDSRIVFGSISDFLQSVREAREKDMSLSERHPDRPIIVEDQKALSQLVRSLLEAEDESDCEELLLNLIPSMDLTDLKLLERLAGMEDFYIVEALANEIAHRPSNALATVARLCAKHSHPQASEAGRKAVDATSIDQT